MPANRYNLTATTTSSSISTSSFAGTKEFLVIQNKGANPLFVGLDEAVATTDCLEIATKASITIPNDSVDVLSFITTGGDSAVVIVSI